MKIDLERNHQKNMAKNRDKLISVCNKLKHVCKDDKYEYKESKKELIKLFQSLKSYQYQDKTEIINLIEIHRSLSSIKNRKASYIEKEIGSELLVDLPFWIRMKDEKIPKDTLEELKADFKNEEREALKMSSELLKYGKEILSSKEDKSKRYKNRVKEAIRMLNELQQFYDIKGIKEIFISKIEDKDKDLQFFALHGLEVYYAHGNVEKLTEEEEKKLEEIIKNTKIRETASTCCQILINANKIARGFKLNCNKSKVKKNFRLLYQADY